jgi:hypothetical protein
MNLSARNPYTPTDGDIFTPTHFLQRFLDFQKWNRENEVQHTASCRDEAHFQVRVHGMCCIPHLLQCIEGTILNLDQCMVGLAVEPDGYRLWLAQAKIRLAELEAGIDNLEYWTNLLETEGNTYYAWIWVENRDHDTQPGFSLQAFKKACKKVGYTPNFKDVADAFYETPEYMEKFWSEPS